jgi:hypothetical protein
MTDELKGRLDMKPTRTRRVVAAAALSTIAIAAPISTAGAATAAPAVAPFATGWDGSPAVTLPATGPVAGQAAAVIGPTIITTAPTTFINTNNQVSAGDNWSGGQAAR